MIAMRKLAFCAAAAIAFAAVALPAFARETGPTCAEKYRAAKATGKLKAGVTEAVFMSRCTEQARNHSSGMKNKPHPE